jgi:phosphoribosylanthranilate isomerase
MIDGTAAPASGYQSDPGGSAGATESESSLSRESIMREPTMEPGFRVKICGIRTTEEASAAIAAGADAIGLNFYWKSRRCVDPAVAARCSDAAEGAARCIGVFVNHPIDEIAAICERVRLDAIQLHGDEPPDAIDAIRLRLALPVVRAIRLPPRAAELRRLLGAAAEPWQREDCTLLLDADPTAGTADSGFGGSGQVLPWDELRDWQARPWILAGGLTETNVAAAIERARPAAVDVASGVEYSDGGKSPERMAAFAQAAWRAFGALGVQAFLTGG